MKSNGLNLTVFFICVTMLIGMYHLQADANPLDDHGDTYKVATDLFLNSSQTGQIDSAEDVDYFRLEITEAGELTVYTTGSLDTVGSIEDDAGVFANGDQEGDGNNFSIVYNAKPETYYIGVRGNQNATGTYTLHASLSPVSGIVGTPELEIIKTPESDIILEADIPASGIIIEKLTEPDFIGAPEPSFTGAPEPDLAGAPEPDVIGALEPDVTDVTDVTGAPEPDIIEVLEPDITEAPGPNIIVEIVDPETHIIVDPENDSRSDCVESPFGNLLYNSYRFYRDEDYFRVQVSPSNAGRILFETTGSTDTIGRLYNSSGTELTYNINSGVGTNFRIVRTLSWGTYYLRVDEYNDDATGSYRVIATTDVDPGPERGSADYLSLNSGSAESIMMPGDVDYFRVRATSYGQLIVYTTGATSTCDTYGRLYNSSGGFLTFDDDDGTGLNFRIAYVVTPGTYYIRVHEVGDNGKGGYNIYTRFVTDDHRNSRSGATSISLNRTRSGRINYTGDADYFRLQVSASMPLTIYTTGSTDTYGLLENSGGTDLATNDDGGAGTNFKIGYNVAPGTYYIRVHEYNNDQTGNYTLHVYTPVDDHSDTRTRATPLSLHSPLTASINPHTDVDYFSVQVGTTGTKALVVETTGITDTYGQLENSSGTNLATNDDGGAGTNFRISHNVTAGTYYIRVSSYRDVAGNYRTGSYTLQARIAQIDVDVNGDDVVNVADLVVAATNYGLENASFAQGDVNGDDTVDRADIMAILDVLDDDSATAPSVHQAESLQRWIDEAKRLNNTDLDFQKGIAVLESLLAQLIEAETIPTVTAALPNYPNPFNPETWIPYQLAAPADVAVTIYDMNGHVVRHLDVGHQRAGLYHSRSRATHWDGRNAQGESVASGIYFYTLKAGDFTVTRKMLIRK